MGLGMQRLETGDVTLVPAEMDVDGFYLDQSGDRGPGGRRLGPGRQPGDGLRDRGPRPAARTVPMSDVLKGEQVVVGSQGIRSSAWTGAAPARSSSSCPPRCRARSPRGSAGSPAMATKERGEKILWVGGPAVVHTGAGPSVVRLIEAGYMDVLFAGNALATHDIEGALYGTSLGVNLAEGIGVEHGHEHHIRALNTIRRCGSIAKAVEQGVLTSGIMHACVVNGVDFVLGGSVRDDGPCPTPSPTWSRPSARCAPCSAGSATP